MIGIAPQLNQTSNCMRKKGINANLSLVIDWLNAPNQGNRLIITVFRLSKHIFLKLGGWNIRCGDSLKEIKEETIGILKDVLDWVNETNEDWEEGTFVKQDEGSIKTVYVLSYQILEQIGVIPSSVECGILI